MDGQPIYPQHVLRQLVVTQSRLDPCESAIDDARAAVQVFLVRGRVAAVRLPEPGGHPKSVFRLRRQLRVQKQR